MVENLRPRKSTILETGLLDEENLTFTLPSSRIRWKSDNSCKCCLKSLKSSIIKPKKACEFCYRAVCPDCSKHRTKHPETQKHERICDECYQNAIEKEFREGYSDELIKVMTDKDQLQNQVEKEQEGSRRLSSEIERLERLINECSNSEEKEKAFEEKMSELKARKEEILNFESERREEIKEVERLGEEQFKELDRCRNEIEEENKREKERKETVLKLRNELAEAQDEKIKILKIFEEKRCYKAEPRSKKEEKMEQDLEKLNDELVFHKQENLKLRGELEEAQEENDFFNRKKTEAKDELRNLNKHPAHALLNSEDKERVMELIIRISSQQKEIDMLETRMALSNGLKLI